MSPVVAEYYEFFRGCRDEFSQTEFKNWQSVLNERRKKREEIVLARNTVLGMTSPFLSEKRGRHGKEDELLFSFAEAIAEFFYASDAIPDDCTSATRLFEVIDKIVEDGDESSAVLIVKDIEEMLGQLEQKWRVVSAAYGELRVSCLS